MATALASDPVKAVRVKAGRALAGVPAHRPLALLEVTGVVRVGVVAFVAHVPRLLQDWNSRECSRS